MDLFLGSAFNASSDLLLWDAFDIPNSVPGEAPVMPADTTLTISENTTAVGTFTVTTGEGVIYSLSGVDAPLFNINSSTGQVSFKTAPDFENPTDVGANNIYNLSVVATNDYGSDSQSIQVTVENALDAGPMMPPDTVVSVSEGVTPVGMFAVLSSGSPVTYALSGVDAALFNLDTSTGVLSFKTAPDYEIPGDSGANNSYSLVITATNQDGSDSQNVIVNVQNVSDNPPVMGADSTVFVVEGNTAVGSFAVTSGTLPIIYSLSGPDSSKFNIGESTGVLSFKTAPDFEAPTDSNLDGGYVVTVTATGNFGQDSQIVTVVVTDKIEVFPPVMLNGVTFNIAEGTAYVGQVFASSGTEPITYTLAGADASLFSINNSNGEIRFLSPPDFESPQDIGFNNVYSIVVIGTNSAGSAMTPVTVNIQDVAEFLKPDMGGDIMVNLLEGTSAVGSFTAYSGDDPITYELGGIDADLFNFDETTSTISFKAIPDYHNPKDAGKNNIYDLQITATNATGSDVLGIAVRVLSASDTSELPWDTFDAVKVYITLQ